MEKQTCSRVALFVLAVGLAMGIAACGSRPTAPPAGSQAARDEQARLAITARPDPAEPRGLLVTGFLSSPEASPLGVMGVRVGDKIVSCNGQREKIATGIVAALDALENEGEPIVLIVYRDGQEMRIEQTEKLSSVGSGQGSE